jgi:hypothetical protein
MKTNGSSPGRGPIAGESLSLLKRKEDKEQYHGKAGMTGHPGWYCEARVMRCRVGKDVAC